MKTNTLSSHQWRAIGAAGLACVRKAGWLPALILTVHGVAALNFNAYNRWPAFDIPMHFAGGLAVAYVAFRCLDELVRRDVMARLNIIVEWILVFAITATVAMHWEFAEWLVDACFDVNAQMGLDDTILDMVLGVLGGLMVVGLTAPQRLRAALGVQNGRRVL
jgi:hypothetical protein